jgi:hypothetical protein
MEENIWAVQQIKIETIAEVGKHDRAGCGRTRSKLETTRREHTGTTGLAVPSKVCDEENEGDKPCGGTFVGILIRGDGVDMEESA